MSIGYFLVINGLIGAILYVPAVLIFQRIMYKMFGQKKSDEAYDDTVNMSEIGYDALAHGDNKKISLYKAISFLTCIFLWEIQLPVTFYIIYSSIKNH